MYTHTHTHTHTHTYDTSYYLNYLLQCPILKQIRIFLNKNLVIAINRYIFSIL